LLNPKQFRIVRHVLARAEKGERADISLKEELGGLRDLSPEDKRAVASAVSTYYRWRGWLNRSARMELQLAAAFEAQARFDQDPAAFSDAELKGKAVPGWVHTVAEISPATLRAFQSAPRLWLRARTGKAGELCEKLGDCSKHSLIPDALEYRGGRDLFQTPEFHKGEFEIQDISSQAVGLLCAPKPGETWLDACAGEGGKTLHLAELMQNKGLVWATDPAEWRLKILKRRAGRAKVFNYRTKVWSDQKHPAAKGPFDGILVDAPCSGIGTWGRNPQARWTASVKDVQELAQIQRDLLGVLAPTVKPGGKLIYSVCTLALPETRQIATAFDGNHPDFKRLKLSTPFTKSANPDCWILPEESGGIGMYIALWQRRGQAHFSKPNLEEDIPELEAELLKAAAGPFTPYSSDEMRAIGERILREKRGQ
jgi:16S rRNA (cytosine967-C5)-methyltransferase